MGLQENYILKLAEQDKRMDDRKFDEYRKIEIIKNPIEKPEGSARVRIGKTDIIAGVKMAVGEPFSDRPDEGILIVNAEFSPLASTRFELGPPRENSIELSRVIDRGIRESGTVDVKKLCITEGEKVWMIFVDINILNHDGNLLDAAGLAAITALNNVKIPEYKDEKVNWEIKTKNSLPLNHQPIPVTIYKLAGNKSRLILDPTLEEEDAIVGSITITSREDGNICAIQKGGTSMTIDEINKSIDISIKKGAELRKLI